MDKHHPFSGYVYKCVDKRWECEGLVIQRDNNGVWVYPEGVDLPYELAKAREDIDLPVEETLIVELYSK